MIRAFSVALALAAPAFASAGEVERTVAVRFVADCAELAPDLDRIDAAVTAAGGERFNFVVDDGLDQRVWRVDKGRPSGRFLDASRVLGSRRGMCRVTLSGARDADALIGHLVEAVSRASEPERMTSDDGGLLVASWSAVLHGEVAYFDVMSTTEQTIVYARFGMTDR